MDDRPGDKREKMQLGARRKTWISTLIYHYWLAAVWERQRQRQKEIGNNKWIQERGWTSLPGFLGSSIISIVADRWSVIPSSTPPTRESVTVTGIPSSIILSAATAYSAPAQKSLRPGVLLLDVSIPVYLRKVFMWFRPVLSGCGLASPSLGRMSAPCLSCSLRRYNW